MNDSTPRQAVFVVPLNLLTAVLPEGAMLVVSDANVKESPAVIALHINAQTAQHLLSDPRVTPVDADGLPVSRARSYARKQVDRHVIEALLKGGPA